MAIHICAKTAFFVVPKNDLMCRCCLIHLKSLCVASHKLFRQIKQNFPLRYFYGESANAIKIQVWVTLIANLLITLLQKGVSRSWSFSGLATIVRIMLMYYIDVQGFLEHPEKDWEEALAAMIESPPSTIDAEK